jgi:hypothetical protein
MCSRPADHQPRLVLGFGNLAERSIRAGIERVADLLP